MPYLRRLRTSIELSFSLNPFDPLFMIQHHFVDVLQLALKREMSTTARQNAIPTIDADLTGHRACAY